MRRVLKLIPIIGLMGVLLACTYARFFATDTESAPSPQQLQRFLKAYAIVKNYYVKQTNDNDLINGAITGMLQALDTHSTFLDHKELLHLKQLTTGQYTGIGIEVVPDDGALKVITPLDGSPAENAGVLPGDEIIEIDDQPIMDMKYSEAIDKMRGPAGSRVQIALIRERNNTPLEFQITRANLNTQNVRSRLITNGIGYIRIGTFQENTANEVENAINYLNQNNHAALKGLIIDLRNNPGGILDSAAAVTNLFLDYHNLGDNHLIVYSKNRAGETVFMAKASDKDLLHNAPIIILINQGSASGAEIMSGALHDQHRATLLGMKSFGKGSVQVVIPLDIDSAVKLTTALYYTPSGKLIDHVGIQPDVEVDMKPFAKPDIQLETAEKILQK
jgi:carboxyl-terminal processing protease